MSGLKDEWSLWAEGDWIVAIATVVLVLFLIVGAWAVTRKEPEVGGHPKGLYILFFAEDVGALLLLRHACAFDFLPDAALAVQRQRFQHCLRCLCQLGFT